MRRRVPVTIDRAQNFAAKRAGRCISKTVKSAKSYIEWKCHLNHKWIATYDSVIQGSWCPTCSGTKKLTIEAAHEIAKRRDGHCLSRRYINGKSPLKWRCKDGHVWYQNLNAVKSGTWCEKCVRPGAGQGIKEMRSLARSRGGLCISKTYKNSRSQLKWQCSKQHRPWLATPDEVKRGRWCPECADGLGERIVRVYLECMLGKEFPSVRPTFLRNPKTGHNLELDGFCDFLRLGFEHQGRQHFNKNSRFSSDNLFALDRLKKKLCKEAGVQILYIPSVPDMLPLNKLSEYLVDELSKRGFRPIKSYNPERIDLKGVFSPNSISKLKQMKAFAEAKNGKCLAINYLGYHGKIEWQCGEGHKSWFASPAKILTGRWCPTCSKRLKKTLEDAIELAASFGGKLLSKKYKNGKTKLTWQCSVGHKWKATFDSVNRGSRCPHCFRVIRKVPKNKHKAKHR